MFRPELNIDEKAKEQEKPVLMGNIRYVKPGLSWNPDQKEREVKSRFKWANQDRTVVEGFLKQLALQCLAEVVAEGAKKVKWYVSFPSVYDETDKSILKGVWKKIVELTGEVTGEIPEELQEKTESVASAIFFTNPPKASNQEKVISEGVIGIDIGGETSDIFILDKSIILQECSVRFAGEHFFTELIRRNPSVLKDLQFKPEDVERIEEAANIAGSFHSELDSLISMNREKLWERLAEVADLKSPAGKVYGLFHLMTLSLSGLMFYAGLHLNDTKDKEKLKSDRLNYLCLGGNGAWTLQWLGLGNFNPKSPQNKLFKLVLKTASGLEQDTDIKIILSKEPKAEVAYGLIASSKPYII